MAAITHARPIEDTSPATEALDFGSMPPLVRNEMTVRLFVSDYCPPASAMQKYVSEVLAGRDDIEIEIELIDTWDHADRAIAEGVLSVPTLIAYRDGVEVDRLHGTCSRKRIRRAIDGSQSPNRPTRRRRRLSSRKLTRP